MSGNSFEKSTRPSKSIRVPSLDEGLIARIELVLRSGGYFTTALSSVSIPRQTGYDWLARGRKDVESGEATIYAAFAAAVDRSRAESEALIVGCLAKNATRGDTKAAIFLLERRHPARWAPERKAEIALKRAQVDRLRAPGPIGEQVDLTQLTDEEFREYRRMIAKMMKGDV